MIRIAIRVIAEKSAPTSSSLGIIEPEDSAAGFAPLMTNGLLVTMPSGLLIRIVFLRVGGCSRTSGGRSIRAVSLFREASDFIEATGASSSGTDIGFLGVTIGEVSIGLARAVGYARRVQRSDGFAGVQPRRASLENIVAFVQHFIQINARRAFLCGFLNVGCRFGVQPSRIALYAIFVNLHANSRLLGRLILALVGSGMISEVLMRIVGFFAASFLSSSDIGTIPAFSFTCAPLRLASISLDGITPFGMDIAEGRSI